MKGEFKFTKLTGFSNFAEWEHIYEYYTTSYTMVKRLVNSSMLTVTTLRLKRRFTTAYGSEYLDIKPEQISDVIREWNKFNFCESTITGILHGVQKTVVIHIYKDRLIIDTPLSVDDEQVKKHLKYLLQTIYLGGIN